MKKTLFVSIFLAVFMFLTLVIKSTGSTDPWISSGESIYTSNDKAKIGIGVSYPNARLHIKNTLNDASVPVASRTSGLLFELPSIIDSNNSPGPAMQWQRESSSSIWRQYFNGGENGWALAYNAIWDYANKKWSPSNGFSALMRFDVSKGDTGQNVFEIKFAPSGDSNGPAWEKGTRYAFYDGGGPSNQPARLSVEGGAGMDAILSLRAGDYGNVSLVADKNNLFKIEKSRDFFNDILGKDLLTIDTITGNVGIGAGPGPTHKLTVAGTAGLTTGTAWTQISDSRYKDVQSELKGSSLEKIMNLHPVSYQWNSLYQDKYGKKDGLNYGFIAQEVQKVVPEFITQDKEGYLWYNPSGFEAILTAAIQEQEGELADLKAELKDIKSKLHLVK